MTTSLEQNAASPAIQPARIPPASKTRAIRVLLVGAEELHREALADKLSTQGFAVRSFSDSASLLASLDAAVDGDIVILDGRLPKTSGIDLLLQLRRHGVNLPVVFLTESLAVGIGNIDESDRSHGAEILIKRVQRVVEAAKPEVALASEDLLCGKLVLKQGVSRAYWSGKDVGLTLGEYNIVHLLASNAGRYVTYRKVYDQMHYEGFVAGSGENGYRANVRSAIKRIRNKFRECDPSFAEIENYTGFGYCWKKPISSIAALRRRCRER
jgi:two-component system, OmpR family, response regulator ChvI